MRTTLETEGDDTMDKHAIYELLEIEEPSLTPRKRLKRALSRLRKGEVLFYPACFNDWAAIRNLSDRCSVYLYCDWHMTLEQFDHEMLQMPFQNPAKNALRFDAKNALPITLSHLLKATVTINPGLLLSFLTRNELVACQGAYQIFANKHPWGRYIHVIHTVDGTDRHLDLLYLCAEGIAIYLQVFLAQAIAPKHLCIRCPGAGYGFGWTDFRDWSKPLGRAVQANSRQHKKHTEFLVAEHHDWEGYALEAEFPEWAKLWRRRVS